MGAGNGHKNMKTLDNETIFGVKKVATEWINVKYQEKVVGRCEKIVKWSIEVLQKGQLKARDKRAELCGMLRFWEG